MYDGTDDDNDFEEETTLTDDFMIAFDKSNK